MQTASELYQKLAEETAWFEANRLRLNPQQQQIYLKSLLTYKNAAKLAVSREHFLEFVKKMWDPVAERQRTYLDKVPLKRDEHQTRYRDMLKHREFVEGDHHKKIAQLLKGVCDGTVKRAYIAMPPRSGKSETISVHFPAYYLGMFPDAKILHLSHTGKLVEGFGRRIRDMIGLDAYREVFPGVEISRMSRSNKRFNTTAGGSYHAVGVGSATAGIGGDLVIFDDPHSEQDVNRKMEKNAFAQEWEWYKTILQRLQPNAAALVVATRWWMTDIPGRIIEDFNTGKGLYKLEQLIVPAIIDEHTPNERSYWPGMWTLEALQETRRIQGEVKWGANYQQKPIDAQAVHIPKELWRSWLATDSQGQPKAPRCTMIIQAWDCAASSKDFANYSACVTFGVFNENEDKRDLNPSYALILLDAERWRLDYPELKKTALAKEKERKPDILIVEQASAGTQLIQEMRMSGLNVQSFKPSRGPSGAPHDKAARYASIKEIFTDGRVYAPLMREWARNVVDELTGQSNYDDLADAAFLCIHAFRKLGYIQLKSDWKAPEKEESRDSEWITEYW